MCASYPVSATIVDSGSETCSNGHWGLGVGEFLFFKSLNTLPIVQHTFLSCCSPFSVPNELEPFSSIFAEHKKSWPSSCMDKGDQARHFPSPSHSSSWPAFSIFATPYIVAKDVAHRKTNTSQWTGHFLCLCYRGTFHAEGRPTQKIIRITHYIRPRLISPTFNHSITTSQLTHHP